MPLTCPAPWVELASDGELDMRAVVAPGMPCPAVKADRTRLPPDSRGDPNYLPPVCIAHTVAAARRITVGGISVHIASKHRAYRGDRRHGLPAQG
jgi:hypothetical protein